MGKCYSCFRAQFKPNEGKTLPGLPLLPKKPDVPGELPRPPSVDSNSKIYISIRGFSNSLHSDDLLGLGGREDSIYRV